MMITGHYLLVHGSPRRIVAERFTLHNPSKIYHNELPTSVVVASKLLDKAHHKHLRLEVNSNYITKYLLDVSPDAVSGSETEKIVQAITGANSASTIVSRKHHCLSALSL